MSEADKLPEILPCHNCGATKHIRLYDTQNAWDHAYNIRCGLCQIEGPCFSEKDTAIHRWNVAFLQWVKPQPAVVLRYRNWRGEVGIRRIVPLRTEHRAEPPWHPDPCWLLDAWDCSKRAVRSFVMTGILEVLREEIRDV